MESSLNLPAMRLASREDSEALLAAIERGCANGDLDRRAGVFGPGSASWKVHRESALFLGAGRAVLLQLAHPWVAAAIAEHSRVLDKPIARFHNTFRVMYTMIFGSADQALAAARHMYGLHARIGGEMPEGVAACRHGSRYEANEIAALRWVFATLIETAVLAYETVLPPLDAGARDAYYAETKTLAALFGIPAGELPADWNAFVAYCRAMEESQVLGVSERARVMGQNLLAGAGSWIKLPRWYRAMTAEWLPERLRDGFGLELGEEELGALAQAKRVVPEVYRRLPGAVRFVGPWHEAQARLRGREAGLIARVSNRFWIGEARLPFVGSREDGLRP
jgi:uncharacterized protein (DUF2236 family)